MIGETTMQIVCTERSHERRRVVIAGMTRTALGAWSEALDGQRVSVPKREGVEHHEWSGQPPASGFTDDEAMVRTRYRFECPLCGLLAVVREDLLMVVLNRGHAAGVNVLPLRTLIATI